MHRIDEIEDKEARIFVKEQNQRVKNGNGECSVPGPVVKPEIVESMMRPRAVGAVAEGHEQPEKHVEGDGADGGEAHVGGKVEDGKAHWQRGASIGVETARSALTFHEMD